MKRIIIAITLILALVIGCFALAETTEPTEQATPEEQTEQAFPEEQEVPEENTQSDAEALQEAFKALWDARLSSKLDELQTELDEYVAAGKITQEQADLIMNSVKERMEAKQNKQCDCQQCGPQGGRMPGMQGGQQQMPQMPGMQGGQQQMPQMPGMQGGQQQMPQAPGMQGGQPGGQMMPRMPGGNHR